MPLTQGNDLGPHDFGDPKSPTYETAAAQRAAVAQRLCEEQDRSSTMDHPIDKPEVFEPGERVYFTGWTPDEYAPEGVSAENAEWATVAQMQSGETYLEHRTTVVYDSAPGEVFDAATGYLVAAKDAPVPDPRSAA
ncbi:hypothetical protein [Curtobacterium sp. VKM Ac-2884]|uniref:hypothetical protein n=1 Tax=Curtobacterium sp. VKM Ac-2884 TaxID=2783818 RepID=UPI00188CCD07|nr:hypothetical protein [Curtobacterium sp. VKM Ac-2884]MBF4602814.1 hypothetical protein [Curtobacterium sp. VKM Ac-2884]